MSQDIRKEDGVRSATEYKLSMSSNPGSRRSSMADAESFNDDNMVLKNDVLREYLLPQIKDLTDSVVTLDSNMTRLNFIHDNLVDLNESFGSLLYGLMCNSWCVEFPNAPTRFDKEIRLMNEIEELSAEKSKLKSRLNSLREKPNAQTSDEKMKKPSGISQPIFQKPNVRRPRNALNDENLHKFNRENPPVYDDKREADEDTNSEASFVSNPANSKDMQLFANGSSNNDPKSRLRRKSILHTIRNSIASTSDAYDRKKQQGIQMGRLSLGGGAARVVSGRNMFEQQRTTRHSTTGIPNRVVKKRPPFK
ncbi:DASH complex subunit Dam1 [Nakaseomyces glabratus]|nr:DASH complex subunit Dam1 [Nakaseomyces glabratus]KAH7601895.1 DASH complex subunit Dam1 [Nakaseomyces glabratus]